MFHKKKDLRIQNTKEFVYEALKNLLSKHKYQDISISMIIKKSGVGRTTFYRHFYTKDDIILTKLKQQTLDLIEQLNRAFDLTIYYKDLNQKIKFFFEYWNQNPGIIELIIFLNKTQLLYNTWSKLLLDMFSMIDMGLESDVSAQYVAHFATGGLTSLLIQWFKNDRKESVDFISKHFYIPQEIKRTD
ncbi:MAG TPA: TetR/AcrR family transcriptional regulator [Haloplasmataceae bacterium]